MTTKDEMLELITVCKLEKSVLNDKKGLKITGPNGNSIFFRITAYTLRNAALKKIMAFIGPQRHMKASIFLTSSKQTD